MSLTPIESFPHAELWIEIFTDDDPENPREWDNAGRMVCWHRRYNLGDTHAFAVPAEFNEWWAEHGEGVLLFPLYLYDHSGITISMAPFSCPWDSGQVGYHCITAAKIKEEWGEVPDAAGQTPQQRAESCLRAETETYDRYLQGEVYGYTVSRDSVGSDGLRSYRDESESCWGFFGLEYCRQEARAAAEGITRRASAAAAKVDQAAPRRKLRAITP